MAFEVNNNGINRVENPQQKKKYVKPEIKQQQITDKDFTSAYEALGASTSAQFQATQKIQSKQQIEEYLKTIPNTFHSGSEFISCLSLTPTISDKEADLTLQKLGFSKEEIAKLRTEYNLTSIVESMQIISDTNDSDFNINKVTKEECVQLIANMMDSEFGDKMNLFLNKTNLEIMKNLFQLEKEDAISELWDILEIYNKEPQEFDQKFHIAVEYANTCKGISPVDMYHYLNQTDTPASIEQIKSRKLLDDSIGEATDIWSAKAISDPSKITPEFVTRYKSTIESLKELNIQPTIANKDPLIATQQRENLLEQCKKLGLDFRWYKSNPQKYEPILDQKVVTKILNTENPEKAKMFLDACSDKSKEKFPWKIIELASSDFVQENPKDISEFLNEVAEQEKELKYNHTAINENIINTIKYFKQNNVKNCVDALKLIKAFDNIGKKPYDADAIFVKDNNYDGAVEFVNLVNKYSKELREDGFLQNNISYHLLSHFNPEWDFTNATKTITALKENGFLPFLHDDRLNILLKEYSPQKIKALELIKKYTEDNYVRQEYLKSDNCTPEFIEETIKSFSDELPKTYDIKDVDKEILWNIATLDKDKSYILNVLLCEEKPMKEKIENLRDELNILNHYINERNKDIYQKWFEEKPEGVSFKSIATIAQKYNDVFHKEELKALVDELIYNPNCKFPKEEVGNLVEHLNTDVSMQFAKDLCFNHYPQLSAEKIKNITMYTQHENIELAKKLCFDEKLKDIDSSILCNTTKNNIKLATRLCYEKLDLPNDDLNEILACSYRSEEAAEFMEKLCYGNERPFPLTSIRYVARGIQHIFEPMHIENDEHIKLAHDLCYDKELNIQPEYIGCILRTICARNLELAKELCKTKDFPKEHIEKILENYTDKAKNLTKKLCFDKELNFPKEFIGDILHSCLGDYCDFDFVEYLCTDSELNFPKEHIAEIVKNITSDNISLAKELCTNSKLNFPKANIAEVLNATGKDNLDLAKKIFIDKEYQLSQKCSIKILKYLKNGSQDKQNKIKSLLSDEKTKNWLIKNIENDLDVDLILKLEKTQAALYREAEQAEIKAKKAEEKAIQQAEKQPEIIEAKSEDIEKAEKILVELGVHPKMAPNYIKLCQENGIVDYDKLNAVCALASANVPFKEFKNIFNIAIGSPLSNMNGQFRIELIKDIVKIIDAGVDDVKLATNLAATINMSDIELHSRLNPNIRTDMVNRLDSLDNEVKTQLINSGFDLESIKEKALKKPKARNINPNLTPKNPIKLRTLDSIVGVEKVVLTRFKQEVPQETWANPEAFKKWAEDKLESLINAKNGFELIPDLTATGEYARFNEARKEGIKNWYEYLTKESNYKDNVFVHLLVMDGITKEMKPNNAVTPPSVSHESFEETYNALLQGNTKVSFGDMYAQQTKIKAIKKYSKGIKTVDGIEGQWVTIPRSKRGEADYDDNIAMVQALAEGSSWCLRFENAHNYLQSGNLHYFLDKNGKAQVAINETDGTITQIQKRYNQNNTVPIAYSTVIEEWANENGYIGLNTARQNAQKAKPEFDKLRATLGKLMSEKNYLEVFRLLGIQVVKTNEDGTFVINKYCPKYKPEYTLFDLGIDENKLMSNVSEILSGLSLEGSSLTALPKLRKVHGKIDFKDCSLNDLRSLESINGLKIYWDK